MPDPKGPSPHLSWAELACRDADQTPYPMEWRADRAVDLACAFERVRAACSGHPLTILSAYRTPEWNAQVGGAPASQHMQGRALDVQPPQPFTVRQFYAIVVALAADTAIRYVEGYPEKGFVHFDIRPSAVLKQKWNG